MADNTTSQDFYAPWPDFGRPLNQQWGEIRHNMAVLAPLVRGAGLDSDGNFSTLDDKEKTALQAWTLGEDGYHNKIRHYWNKDKDRIEIQANIPPGTNLDPHWYPVWAVNDDGQVTQQTTPTTASNVGTGADVFKQKSGTDLEFRTIKASGVLTVAENSLDLTFTSTAEANTASSLGGTSLVGTKSGVNLPFKGLVAGDGMELTIGPHSITLTSTLQQIEFYGIVVANSDDSFVRTSAHVLKFNVEHFYVSGATSEKEAMVNLRGFLSTSGGTLTGALLLPDGSEAAPALSFSNDTDSGLARLADDDVALVSGGTSVLRALTDRVYLPTNLQIMADGTAAAPDMFFFPDSDTGLYQPATDQLGFATGGERAGWFDDDQNLHVQNDLRASRVEVGYGEFYTSIRTDRGFFGISNASTNFTKPQMAFSGSVKAEGSGFGYNWNADYPFMAVDGVVSQFWASSYMAVYKQLRAYTWVPQGATVPAFSFQQDTNTGMFQIPNGGDDNLRFGTGGVEAGRFDENQNFHVFNDVKSGRVEAGIGNFYTSLDVGSLTLASGSITDSTGTIDFDSDDLTIGNSGSITVGSLYLAPNTINDSSGLYIVTPEIITSAPITAGKYITGTTQIDSGSITDITGTLSFNNENLITTGIIKAGSMQVDNFYVIDNVTAAEVHAGAFYVGTLRLLAGSITDSSGAIDFEGTDLTTTGQLDVVKLRAVDGDGTHTLTNAGILAGQTGGVGHILEASGVGSTAMGYAKLGDIKAQSSGSFAQGYTKEATGGTALIQAATGSGAFAQGYVKSVEHAAQITSTGTGSFAQGAVQAAVSGATTEINATASGAFAQGVASGSNDGVGKIVADGTGSFAHGQARSTTSGYTGYIHAKGIGSVVLGRALVPNTTNADSILYASGISSFVHGYTQAASITSSGIGSFAQGFSTYASVVESSGNGAFAQGAALGYGIGYSGGYIYASGSGSFAQGYTYYGTTIKASAHGAFAQGYASGGGADIYALQVGAVQFGGGTNNTQDTFQIGSEIHFKPTVVSRFDHGLVVNEGGTGGDDRADDFRVETNNEDKFLVVDASADILRIGDFDTNYTQVAVDGTITQVGTARINWSKIVAGVVDVTGFTEVGQNDAWLQTANDGTFFTAIEVAGGGNDVTINFTSVTAFNWVRVIGTYEGSSSHCMAVQLYDWGNTAWHTFDTMQDGFSNNGIDDFFGNYDFFVPADSAYIGTGGDAGKVQVRLMHSTTTVNNHELYIDEVALYQ